MSAMRVVPAAVPSDRQSSVPPMPSSALKNSVGPTAVSSLGAAPATPVLMSAIGTVPAAVPSEIQSSGPVLLLPAWKTRERPSAVR